MARQCFRKGFRTRFFWALRQRAVDGGKLTSKMHVFVELFINSVLLWIFLQTTLSVLVTVLYEFCVPWMVWTSLFIMIMLKLMRVSSPAVSVVQEVLGVNPLHLGKDNFMPENHGNGEQYCMRVVAHRGGGYDYPENSLSAFRNVKLYILTLSRTTTSHSHVPNCFFTIASFYL